MNQAPRKILYVITKSNWGGAQRYVFDLASNLPKSGFEVAVALGGTGKKGSAEGELARRLRAIGVRTIFVRSFVRNISFVNDIRIWFELRKLLRQERPDVVHLNSSKAGVVGAIVAKVARVHTVVFTAHGWPFEERRFLWVRVALWLSSWLTALLCRHVIVLSDKDLGLGRKMPFVGRKMVKIYNGIDLNAHYGAGEMIRSAFPPGATITGTIGELNRNKNQIALVEAARKDPSMHVAIVGEGELDCFLQSKVREYGLQHRVKLFGFVPAQDVVKGFDVFALPSLKEGLPYVLLEAKLAGVPIEANPVGGVPDILERNVQDFSLERMLYQTKTLY